MAALNLIAGQSSRKAFFLRARNFGYRFAVTAIAAPRKDFCLVEGAKSVGTLIATKKGKNSG